jgi:hypothetical protein
VTRLGNLSDNLPYGCHLWSRPAVLPVSLRCFVPTPRVLTCCLQACTVTCVIHRPKLHSLQPTVARNNLILLFDRWEVCRYILASASYKPRVSSVAMATTLYRPNDCLFSAKLVPTFLLIEGLTWSAQRIPTAVLSTFYRAATIFSK